MAESKTSARRIEAVEKQRSALEYRKMGATYEQIAEQVGYKSPQAAHEAIKSALKRIVAEPGEDVLKLELSRLDAMFMPHYQRATQGDHASTVRCLEIMTRRAKMLGIDIDKHEHAGPGGAPLQGPVIPVTVYLPDNGRPNVVPQQD
jgi:hypothetical protein